MLPMLSYMGHWENPATLLQRELLGGHHHHVHPEVMHAHTQGERDHHTQHCHGDVSSCSDIPYAGSASVVLLAYAVHGLAWGAPSWLQEAAPVTTPIGLAPLPATPPPKAA